MGYWIYPAFNQSLENQSPRRKISISSSAATMRVLSVLRHWITKHSQVSVTKNKKKISEQNSPGFWGLKATRNDCSVLGRHSQNLNTPTYGAQGRLSAPPDDQERWLNKQRKPSGDHGTSCGITPARNIWISYHIHFQFPSKENLFTLSALEIAEQMTFMDQKILFSICSQ